MMNTKVANDNGVPTSRVRHELNTARFSWFHVKAILVAGVGFYTDAYDLFVIGLVKPMIAVLYYPELNGKLAKSDDLWITGVALVGTLIGQVFFGVCGDYLGRKRIYLVTLVIMIVATLGQALAASPIRGWGMLAQVCIWRFVLGIGIGGDYPLSASIASEYASTKWRGAFVGSVFAAQGFGILSAAIVSTVVIACFHYPIVHMDINYLDYVWRIIIGFGAIPCVLTIWLRATIPETPRYTADVELNEAKALRNVTAVKAGTGQFVEEYADKSQGDRISCAKLRHYLTYPSILQNRNFWVLIGTASTWFLLDIAFYSQNLFLPNILEGIGYNPSIKLPISSAPCAKTHSCTTFDQQFNPQYKCTGVCAQQVYDKMFKTAAGSAITACMGTVPGYWFTVALVDTMGRVTIQYMGFIIMTTILIILAAAYVQIKAASIWLFIVLYALTFFFANFGPNATTFITPVELFTTKYRSTLHGISAASGKAGAIVGAFGFGELVLTAGIQKTLGVLAITNFLGLLCTVFVPETKRIDLDEAALHSESHFGKFMRSIGRPQVNPAVAESLNGGAHGPGNGVNGVPGNGVPGNGVAAPMTKEEQVKM